MNKEELSDNEKISIILGYVIVFLFGIAIGYVIGKII